MPFDEFEHERKDDRDIVSVSLNKEEREILEFLKKITSVKNDSTALKNGMIVSVNVIQSIFGRFFKSITLKRKITRDRLSQE